MWSRELMVACAAGVVGLTAHGAQAADEPMYRFEATVAVQRSAPFVELAMPAEAYARSRAAAGATAAASAGITDLRIVDSRGERVPFAWLAPRSADVATRESSREVALYALPSRPAADGNWRSPIDVVITGDRVQVRKSGGSTTDGATRSGGWVFDLGERKPNELVPEQLRLAWSAPQEFSAAFDLATSDDLRNWRAAGSGQVIALQPGPGVAASSATSALTQPNIALPQSSGRFVRLVWVEPANAPRLTGAKAIAFQRDAVARDAPVELSFTATSAKADAKSEPKTDTIANNAAARAIDFDFGGTLPIVDVELQWTEGTHVAPVRILGRQKADDSWRELGSAVFYRLDRQGVVSTSPAWPLRGAPRYLRFVPDERAAALDSSQTRLRVHAELAHLVFAAQGTPPYRVQIGMQNATLAATALPIGALVPSIEDERAKFGSASVGAWSEVAEAARRDDARQREAALRPWVLWAVLVVGVALLAFMVWRLAKSANRSPTGAN